MDNHRHGADTPDTAAPELAYRPVVDLALLGAGTAPPAGLTHPEKYETPRLAGAEGFRWQEQNNIPDCADPATECKPFPSLVAHAAVGK